LPSMQYVRSISGSVSKTWNSINPATLSGAIDVVVVEREDGLSISSLEVPFAHNSQAPLPAPHFTFDLVNSSFSALPTKRYDSQSAHY
jgi:phosphatidate phosphatase LPIN